MTSAPGAMEKVAMLVRSAMPVVVSRWMATGLVMALLATLSAGQAAAVDGGSEPVSTADTLPGFADVPADHVFATEVAWLASIGITQGRGDGTFGLNDPVTRGAMAAFLYRSEGEPAGPVDAPEFDDVPAGHAFATEVGWLASTGITLGRGDGSFGVSAPVTRGAMAAFLYRYDGEPDGPFDAPAFDDVPPAHTFATEVAWLASSGITQGRGDGSFGLNDPVTRGAMAAFLYRYAGEPEGPFEVPDLPDDGSGDDPDAPATADGQRWQRVAHDGAVFGGMIAQGIVSVTAGGPGLVAVGSDGTRRAAAVWTSVDGLSWQRVAHDESVFGGDGFQGMTAVTAGGPGLVAVGYDQDGSQTGAVWTSVDGLSWQRVAHDESVFGGDGRLWMSSVTAGGPGFVAVGFDVDRSWSVVWTSPDGRTWQRVAHDDAVFGGADTQRMNAVVAGGPGFVAVGVAGSFDDPVAAVWTSTDGATWQRIAHDDAVFGGEGVQEMLSVTTGGPGLVAVGSSGVFDDAGAAVWTSVDGVAWQRVGADEAVFGGDGRQSMLSVTAGGPGLVAVGSSTYGFGEGPMAWTSADGATWQRSSSVDDLGGAGSPPMRSVTRGGLGLVAVGAPGAPTEPATGEAPAAVVTSVDGGVWQRVPPDQAVFGSDGFQGMTAVTAAGPGLVAVGIDTADAAVWTSVDGVTWRRVAHDESVFGDGELRSVTRGGPGLVAVGASGAFGEADAAVWTSVDGVSWQRVAHDDAVFGGDGQQEMTSVAVGGPGLVAVGSSGPLDARSAAVWTSVDGVSWQRVAHDEAVFGGSGEQQMRSVTAGGPGLVAVGSSGSFGARTAAVWTSVDGVSWQRGAHDDAVFGDDGSQSMSSVATGGPGLVAVGRDEGRNAAAVWTSVDGLVWQRIAHDAVFGGDGRPRMSSVTSGGQGLVAVGSGAARNQPAAWTSSDGAVWERAVVDGAAADGHVDLTMVSVAVGGPGLVAVGADMHNGQAAVWTSP